MPGLEDLKNRKPDDELLGTGGDPDAPPEDPRDALEAAQAFDPFGTKGDGGGTSDSSGGGTGNATKDTSSGSGGLGGDARDTGAFDLLQDPGADGDPLTSFLGAVESRLGRDLGPAPSDQTNDPVGGAPSVAAGRSLTEIDRDTGAVRKSTVNDDAGLDVFESPTFTEVKDTNNGTITRVFDDGSTTTTTLGGTVIDSTPSLSTPDPDEQVVELPEALAQQLESDVARFRALKPETGDGTSDPSEIESEVVGAGGALPDRAQLGEELFGQPNSEVPSGSDANFDPGADSSGAGVITPSDDKDVAQGRTRNDDALDGDTTLEPAAGNNDATADSVSFLPSAATGTAIDSTPDVPDPTGGTRTDDPFDADAAPVTSSNDATDDSVSFLPSETEAPAIDDTPDVPDPVNDPV